MTSPKEGAPLAERLRGEAFDEYFDRDKCCALMNEAAAEIERLTLALAEERQKNGEVIGDASAPTYDMPADGWVCFHCGVRFKSPGAARRHFGETPAGIVRCQESLNRAEAADKALAAERALLLRANDCLRVVCHHLELPQSESGPCDDSSAYDRALEALDTLYDTTETERIQHATARYKAEAERDSLRKQLEHVRDALSRWEERDAARKRAEEARPAQNPRSPVSHTEKP